jgi:ParB family chromosome partitioning protein
MTTKTKGRPLPAAETTDDLELKVTHLGPVKLELLNDSPFNARRTYDDRKLEDLANVYRFAPETVPRPLVRKRPVGFEGPGYELIHGHRRKRAAARAGLVELDVDLVDVDDHVARMLQWAENGNREDLTPLEEADFFAGWLATTTQDVGGLPRKVSPESIAAEIARPVAFVRSRLKLALLVADGRAALADGRLGVGQAQLIAGLPGDQQTKALERALTEDWNGRMTVRALARWIEEQSLDLKRAPWELDDSVLAPAAGACTACPKRTGASGELFVGAIDGDRCLDRTCWDEKLKAHVKQARKTGELLEITDAWGNTVKKDGAPLPRACYVSITPSDDDLQDLKHDVEVGLREDLALADDAPLPQDKLEQRLAEERAYRFKECEHARDALVKSGPDKGQTRRVCAEPKCPVHGEEIQAPKVAGDKPDASAAAAQRRDWQAEAEAAKEKRDFESKVRCRALRLAMDKVKLAPGGFPTRDILAQLASREINLGDLRPFIEDLVDWKPPEGRDVDMSKLDPQVLTRTLIASLYAGDLDGYRDADELLAFVKSKGVDVKKVRADLKAEAKPKPEKPVKAEQAKPAAKKKAKAKAKR